MPTAAGVAELGDTALVTVVQPGRLTELPPRLAAPVQLVAFWTVQLTENAAFTSAADGAVKAKPFGVGAGPITET